MAMAHKPPSPHYTRTYYVTEHAVLRLRERIDKKSGHPLAHRGDKDLANFLDESVKICIQDPERVSNFEREGKVNKAIDISDRFGSPLRAILAPNNRDDSQYREAIVTIFTDTMDVGKSIASIGDAIPADVRRSVADSILKLPAFRDLPPDAGKEKPASKARGLRESTKFSTREVAADVRMVTNVVEGEERIIWTVADKQSLRERLLNLHKQGVDMSQVSVWKPTCVSIELALDFDET